MSQRVNVIVTRFIMCGSAGERYRYTIIMCGSACVRYRNTNQSVYAICLIQ
jgi:hypothetical protein